MNEIRRLAGAIGKNTGILKLLITEYEDDIKRKKIDLIIRENEKIKEEIKSLIEVMKKELGSL